MWKDFLEFLGGSGNTVWSLLATVCSAILIYVGLTMGQSCNQANALQEMACIKSCEKMLKSDKTSKVIRISQTTSERNYALCTCTRDAIR